MAWTDSEVVSYVMAQFGHPKRKVELDPSNITESLKKAIRKYAHTKPVIKKGSLLVTNGVQAYNLRTLSKPYGKGLLNLYPEPITSPASIFNEFEYYRLRQPPYVDMSELVTDRMYYKEIGLLTGTDFDWEWDQASTILLVKPIPTRTFTVAYDYNDSPDALKDIPLYDQDWVVDYTLALCKEMLGRVRGKFKGVPGNDLPVDTDWSELLTEGKADQEKLLEDLNSSRGDWTPPITG